MPEATDPLPHLKSLLHQVLASASTGFYAHQPFQPALAQGPSPLGRAAETFKASQLRDQLMAQVRDIARVQPAPAQAEVQAGPDVEAPLISEADLIEMKRVCAANGEVWRLRMITAYEQAVEAMAFMYQSPVARQRMEVRLQQDLLMELGEYLPEV